SALRAVARHRSREEADLPAGAALLLLSGTPAGPVLWARAVSVARRSGARDGCDQRRAAGGDAAARRVRALRAGRPQAAAARAGRNAQQSGVERLLSVEERRGRRRKRGALSAHDAGAAGLAAGARSEPLAFDP